MRLLCIWLLFGLLSIISSSSRSAGNINEGKLSFLEKIKSTEMVALDTYKETSWGFTLPLLERRKEIPVISPR